MEGISIQVDDRSLRNLLKDFNKFSSETQKGVTKEIRKSAMVIETTTKTNTPVVTGRLRSSWVWRMLSKASAKVSSIVEYAPDVENGHSARTVKVPAHTRVSKTGKRSSVRSYTANQRARKGRHMLRNAANSEFPKLVRRLTTLLNKR